MFWPTRNLPPLSNFSGTVLNDFAPTTNLIQNQGAPFTNGPFLPQQPLSVPQDGGRPGSRGVNVRGLTSIDFPLQPNSADIGVVRSTTLSMGTAQTPGLLQVRKVVLTSAEEGVYRVQLVLTAAQPLNGFTLSDPLPVGATLLDGANTLALGTLPAGELALTYRFRFTGAPSTDMTSADMTSADMTRAAVTDPVAGWNN